MAAWATSLKFSTATRPSGLAAVSRRRGAWQKYCGRWWRMFTDCGRCYSRRFQLRRPERPPPCGLRYRDRPVCGRAPIHKQRMYVTSGCSVSPEDSQARARASAQAGQGVPAPSSGLPRSPPEKNSCAALSAACWAGYGHRPNGDSSLGHFRSRDGFATESQRLIPEPRSPTVGLQTTRMALRRRIRDLRTPPERRQTLLSESQTSLPSTGITAPLMALPASPASHVIKLATVAGRTHLEKSAFGIALRFVGVSIVPGKITLAVSPASLFSRATVLIRETMAALEALYAPTPAPGSSAARLPIAIMRPVPACRSAGIVTRRM